MIRDHMTRSVTITNALSAQVLEQLVQLTPCSHHYNAFNEKTFVIQLETANRRGAVSTPEHDQQLQQLDQLTSTIDFAGSGTNHRFITAPNSYTYLTNLVATHTDEHG